MDIIFKGLQGITILIFKLRDQSFMKRDVNEIKVQNEEVMNGKYGNKNYKGVIIFEYYLCVIM